MKKIILLSLLVLISFQFGCSKKNPKMNVMQTTELWYTDYKKSLEIAKTKHRKTLLYFGGSTWCGPCIQLRNEVFYTDEFKTYATDHLVLVYIDFPRDRSQSQELFAQNANLMGIYGVMGLPTVILLDENAKVVDSLVGYESQYKSEYIKLYRE